MAPSWRDHGSVSCVIDAGICEVVEAEPGRRFAFRTVPARTHPGSTDSTVWSYLLEPDGDRTRVTHEYRIAKWPLPPVRWLYGRLFPQHRDMRPQMTYTLDALRAELEGTDR